MTTKWTWHELGNDWCISDGNDDSITIAAPNVKPSPEHGLLMSAAPELLEALQGVLRITEAVGYTMQLSRSNVDRINFARAAIAKAKGKS